MYNECCMEIHTVQLSTARYHYLIFMEIGDGPLRHSALHICRRMMTTTSFGCMQQFSSPMQMAVHVDLLTWDQFRLHATILNSYADGSACRSVKVRLVSVVCNSKIYTVFHVGLYNIYLGMEDHQQNFQQLWTSYSQASTELYPSPCSTVVLKYTITQCQFYLTTTSIS